MKFSLTGAFLLLLIFPVFADIIYVRQEANGDGSSWANATNNLSFALENAVSGDEIYISMGTYYPTTGTDRNSTFSIPTGVAIYGGFTSVGNPSFETRDVTTYPTTLSGDIGSTELIFDNVYTVVTVQNIAETVILDNLIIAEGFANEGSEEALPNSNGGAIFYTNTLAETTAALEINQCIFQNNTASKGGAIFARSNGTRGNLIVNNCTFSINKAKFGGAIHTESANNGGFIATTAFCEFSKNESTEAGGAISNFANGGDLLADIHSTVFKENIGVLGGALYNFPLGASLEVGVTNCVFSLNTGQSGGAIENFAFTADPLNLNVDFCSFNGNRGEVGGAISIFGGGVRLMADNSIFWSNFASDEGHSLSSQFEATASLRNCLVQELSCNTSGFNEVTCEDMIFNKDPLFVDTAQHNLRLLPCSPAIDNGGMSEATVEFDLAGNPRTHGVFNDLGAYEAQNTATDTIIYVNKTNTNSIQDGGTWNTAFSNLQDALTLVKACGITKEIWIAAGTYFPTETTDQAVSFKFNSSLKVYGGFVGTESSVEERNLNGAPTILSGDIGELGVLEDNTKNVVQIDADVLLNQLTIQDGNAGIENGGGVLIGQDRAASVHLQEVKILNNRAQNGGGIALMKEGQLILEDCLIAGNDAQTGGGGLYREEALGLVVRNSRFFRNTARSGGAIHQVGNDTLAISMTLINSVLAQNSATDIGGAIYNSVGSTALINCTIADNTSRSGAASYNVSTISVTQRNINTIFSGNTSINPNSIFVNGFQSRPEFINCLLEQNNCPNNATCENSLLGETAFFINPSEDNYEISNCSPAIGMGAETLAPPTDIEGNMRNANVDIGAYEITEESSFEAAIEAQQNITCIGSNDGGIRLAINDFIAPLTIILNNDTIATDTVVNSLMLNELSGGVYTFTVIDGVGCISTVTTEIEEPSESLSVDLEMVNEIECADECTGQISATVAGSEGDFTLEWSTGATALNINDLCSGIYSLTVTDLINGCVDTAQVELLNPEPLILEFEKGNLTAPNAEDGFINVNVFGGTADFTFVWSDGMFSEASRSNLTAGNYCLTVTDSNDCSESTCIEIAVDGADILNIDEVEIANVSCNGGNDASISVTPSGGTAPYNYMWDDTFLTTTERLENVSVGMYCITITDANNLQKDTCFIIAEPEALTTVIEVEEISCKGSTDGSININVAGGTSPYSYSWNNGNTNTMINGLSSGTYVSTITDANGCEVIDSITIVEPDSIIIALNTMASTGNDGAIEVLASEFPEYYEYSWTDENGMEIGTTAFLENLSPGTYCVTVKDPNSGCIEMACTEVPMIVNTNNFDVFRNWNVYPIPTKDKLSIVLDFNLSTDYQLNIVNVLGAVLLTEKVEISEFSLDLSGLASGIYYVHLVGEGNQSVKRIVVQ